MKLLIERLAAFALGITVGACLLAVFAKGSSAGVIAGIALLVVYALFWPWKYLNERPQERRKR